MDEETKQKIEQIDDKVTRKLIKHRENISEKDMKRLLNEARKQQDDIIRQRNIERVKQNELMRKRLLEKKRAKVSLHSTFVAYNELFPSLKKAPAHYINKLKFCVWFLSQVLCLLKFLK